MSAVLKYKKMWQLESRDLRHCRYGSKRFSPYDLSRGDDLRFCKSSGNSATAVPIPSQDDTRAYCLSIPDHSAVITPSCSSEDGQQPLDLRVNSRKRNSPTVSDPLDDLKCYDEIQESSPPPPREERAEIPAEPIVSSPSTPFVEMEPQVPPSDSLASPLSKELRGYRNGHLVLPSFLPLPSMEHQVTRPSPFASPSTPAVEEPEQNQCVQPLPSCSPPSEQPANDQPATEPSNEHPESTSIIFVAGDVDDHFKQALGLSVYASVCQATPVPPPLKQERSESVATSNTIHHYPAPADDAKSTSSLDSAPPTMKRMRSESTDAPNTVHDDHAVADDVNSLDSSPPPSKRMRSASVSPSNTGHHYPADDPKSTSPKDSVCASLLNAYFAADYNPIAGKRSGRKRLRNRKATVVPQHRSKNRPDSA